MFRVEGEFGYRNADVDTFRGTQVADGKMDTSIYSYMANAYWDIKTRSAVTPFLGAGIGLLHGRFTDPYFTFTDNVFGYQFCAGTGIAVTRQLNIDLTYKYQAAAKDFHNIGVYDVSYASSNLLVGVRYDF